MTLTRRERGECPEWCDHGGKCAQERDSLYRFEAQAESAIERYREGGWDTAGQYGTDRDREEEANDEGLRWMRENREGDPAFNGAFDRW
jgi:hypothetical protein